jgi:murein DD-endopeptidase MepM/ murein hydrolase activator NlpD
VALAVAAAIAIPAASAGASAGGAWATEAARIGSVTCRTACAGLDRARTGSVVRVAGDAMDGAAGVVFLGRPGRRDDVTAPVTGVTPQAVDVQVPARARSGRVRVLKLDGPPSTSSATRLVLSRRTLKRFEARVDAKRVFSDGGRKASLSFFVGGSQPANVAVALVRRGETVPLASWTPGAVAPGSVQTVEWDGLVGGATPPEGRYEFRVFSDEASAQASTPAAIATFVLLRHKFPIAGKHSFGEGAAAFGATREGHTHEGQDVFAACGTPLVAARGGTVKFKAKQSAAGNYVVIASDDSDYAYMHMRDAALVSKGDTVRTGQRIGFVGDTGHASGCHLHFEMWTAPGWYSGGKPIDPLPALLAWDAQT